MGTLNKFQSRVTLSSWSLLSPWPRKQKWWNMSQVCAVWGFVSSQAGETPRNWEPKCQPVLLCCAAASAAEHTLLLLGSSKGGLIVNICVQTSFYSTTCHQFVHSLAFCQQICWLFKTRLFEGGVVIVAVDKQVNEEVTKMPFHQWKLGNQLQKPFPIPVWFCYVWSGCLISISSWWEQRENFISGIAFPCLEKERTRRALRPVGLITMSRTWVALCSRPLDGSLLESNVNKEISKYLWKVLRLQEFVSKCHIWNIYSIW